MVTGLKVTKQDCPTDYDKLSMLEEQKNYRSILASIIYFVSWTRPDIALAVSRLCRFMHNPGKTHITALKRLSATYMECWSGVRFFEIDS